jgi:hypothetical protein
LPKGSADQHDGFSTVSLLDLDHDAGSWYLIYGRDSPTIQKRCTTANYVYNPDPIFGGPPTVGIVNYIVIHPWVNTMKFQKPVCPIWAFRRSQAKFLSSCKLLLEFP